MKVWLWDFKDCNKTIGPLAVFFPPQSSLRLTVQVNAVQNNHKAIIVTHSV